MSESLEGVVSMSNAHFVAELYRLFFGREPDGGGFDHNMRLLESGLAPLELIKIFLESDELKNRKQQPAFTLPNLRTTHPERYSVENDVILFQASEDSDINFMQNAIHNYGFYDRYGAWSHQIDADKQTVAQLIDAFGSRSCLEVGCFNGPILSILKDKGIVVRGIDPSHLAFVASFPNIREDLVWGDLLTARIDGKFDCILLLDVLEHVNPLSLDRHIIKISNYLSPNGVIILNAPMFGSDKNFGEVFQQYIEEWRVVGDTGFYRKWPCDENGWPIHGHMVFASPKWWEQKFAFHGFKRQDEIEQVVQHNLSHWFEYAPSRKSLFLLTRNDVCLDANSIGERIKSQSWPVRPAQNEQKIGKSRLSMSLSANEEPEEPGRKFSLDYDGGGAETRKSYIRRVENGFFQKYYSGEVVLDIGFRGADNDRDSTIVQHAIGIDTDFPGYDGTRLPFEDETVDCVSSSHCLEHIMMYQRAIADWYRVLKIGGFLSCIVPHQHLYEKKLFPPSRYNGEHVQFFTPSKLMAVFEETLGPNAFRVRHLEDNDFGFDYAIGPKSHSTGCYEIELVIQKISRPTWTPV